MFGPCVTRGVGVSAKLTRWINTTVARKNEKISEEEVPVVQYSSDSGGPHHTILKVDQAKPVTTPILDVAKKAFALERGIIKKLSPTMAKFTLDGKVALVTGYAHSATVVTVLSC